MGVGVQDVSKDPVPTHSLSRPACPPGSVHESILQPTTAPRRPGSFKVVFSTSGDNPSNAPAPHSPKKPSQAPHIAFGTLPGSGYFPDQPRDSVSDSLETASSATASAAVSTPETNASCDQTTLHPSPGLAELPSDLAQRVPSHGPASAGPTVERSFSLPKDQASNPATSVSNDASEPKRRLNSRGLTLDGIRFGVSQLPARPCHELRPVQDYVPTPYVQLDSFVSSPYDAGTPDGVTTPHHNQGATEARNASGSSSGANAADHQPLPEASDPYHSCEKQQIRPCSSKSGAAAPNQPHSMGLSTTLHNLAHRMTHKLKHSTDHRQPTRRANNTRPSAE